MEQNSSTEDRIELGYKRCQTWPASWYLQLEILDNAKARHLKSRCPYLPVGPGRHTISQNGCTELAGYGNL